MTDFFHLAWCFEGSALGWWASVPHHFTGGGHYGFDLHLPVPAGHSYVFLGEMSVQGLGPHKSGYLSYYSVLGSSYIIYRCPLSRMWFVDTIPFCCLSFHILESVLWGTNVFHFDEVQFILSLVCTICPYLTVTGSSVSKVGLVTSSASL